MSNGLAFEILQIILRNFQGYRDSVENRLIIDAEIDEKHALLVSCGLRYSPQYRRILGNTLIIIIQVDKKRIV